MGFGVSHLFHELLQLICIDLKLGPSSVTWTTYCNECPCVRKGDDERTGPSIKCRLLMCCLRTHSWTCHSAPVFKSSWDCWGMLGSTNMLADVLALLIGWQVTYTQCAWGQCNRSFSKTWTLWFSLPSLIGHRGQAERKEGWDMITLPFHCSTLHHTTVISNYILELMCSYVRNTLPFLNNVIWPKYTLFNLCFCPIQTCADVRSPVNNSYCLPAKGQLFWLSTLTLCLMSD